MRDAKTGRFMSCPIELEVGYAPQPHSEEFHDRNSLRGVGTQMANSVDFKTADEYLTQTNEHDFCG